MKKLSLLLAVILLITVFTGCGASDTENTVSVQSVSMVTGAGGVGLAQRFAGIVSARSETKIETDSQKEVGEIFVKVGDNVQVGDLLFTYDMELAELNYEKLELEIAQLKGSLEAKKEEKSTLEKEKNKASSSEQLSYTIAIAECDTAIREYNYNITLKEKELERLAESLDVVDCTSPVEGRIQSVNPDGGFDNSGNPLPFISILETGVYRVKGTVNEMNASALEMGMRVTVRSRRNENLTWPGAIATVDWENPETTNDNSYFGNNDIMTSTTKYPFYVELDDAEGLLLGEHVYIEPAIVEENEGLMLPEWYLIDIDTEAGTANIWAQNAKGKLEKRAVKLGTYNPDMCTYEITEGLALTDYIAYPDETLTAGMTCVTVDETGFDDGSYGSIEDGSFDGGSFDGGSFDGGAIAADGGVIGGALAMPAVEVAEG